MANVIKHKRGSGSDPAANNLVLGELAIRTDVGKLFTKMDSGSVAEIAGGGSDIAINTLSSSSATGGGSATFNGSAYRFTLSAPPSVSAQQLLVSINGVIQKPVAGTGQPSEGFSVDGNDIILGDAPATGADFFILTFKSLGVSEPADNSVTSAKIADGAIVNADVNASAAIAGTKISPSFGNQDIQSNQIQVFGKSVYAEPTSEDFFRIKFNDTGGINNDVGIGQPDASSLAFNTISNGTIRFYNGTDGEMMRLDASGRLGINTISPSANLESEGNVSSTTQFSGFQALRIQNANGAAYGVTADINFVAGTGSNNRGAAIGVEFSGATNGNNLYFATNPNNVSSNDTLVEAMRITYDAKVGIGTTSPSTKFVVSNAGAEGLEVGHSSGTVELIGYNRSGSARSPIDIVGQTFKVLTGNPGLSTGLFQDSSGNVGIGIASNGRKLHLHEASSDNNFISITNSTTGSTTSDGILIGMAGDESLLISNKENNGIQFHTNNTERMRIDSTGNIQLPFFDANNGLRNKISWVSQANFFDEVAYIAVDRTATSGAVSDMVFATGSANAVSERVRILSDGRVSFNSNGTVNATYQFDYAPATGGIIVNTNATFTGNSAAVQFRTAGSTISGSITLTNNGTTTAYVTSSDYRLKENAVAISDGITRLKTLKPYRFNFKSVPDKTVDGFFAHEVTAVPEAIVGDKDETKNVLYTEEDTIPSGKKVGDVKEVEPVYQSMDYGKITPLLTAALQEAIAKIETLETKVAALEAS